jgi:hypothetical protein
MFSSMCGCASDLAAEVISGCDIDEAIFVVARDDILKQPLIWAERRELESNPALAAAGSRQPHPIFLLHLVGVPITQGFVPQRQLL